MNTREIVAAHQDTRREVDGLTNILFTGLYGSQNYGIDTVESDVDTKTIYVPSFENIVFGRGNVSTEYQFPDGSLDSAMTLVHFGHNLLKGSINFVEILFTPWISVAPCGQALYKWLMENREAIARVNPNGILHACMGHIMRNWKLYQRHDESENKAVATMVRLAQFMRNYCSEMMAYEEILSVNSPRLYDIRMGRLVEENNALVSAAMATAEQYVNTYTDTESNQEVVDALNEAILETYRETLNYE